MHKPAVKARPEKNPPKPKAVKKPETAWKDEAGKTHAGSRLVGMILAVRRVGTLEWHAGTKHKTEAVGRGAGI